MKKIMLMITLVLYFGIGAFAKNHITAAKIVKSVSQEEIKSLTATNEERHSAWILEHVKNGGNKSSYTSIGISTKRRNAEEAIAIISLNSTEKKVYQDSPDIDVFIKPIEISYDLKGDKVTKDSGSTTQLRSGKGSPDQLGKSGKQSEFVTVFQLSATANAIEVTTKIIGKDSNRSYVSIVPVRYDLSSSCAGGSPPSEVSYYNKTASQNFGAFSLRSNNLFTEFFQASPNCRTQTLSCSCTGCLNCSTSKSCKDYCYPMITACDPIRGTCSISCCDC